MLVYHFSEAKHALNNIALQRIKIARIDDLNDPFELLGAYLRSKELRHAFIQTKKNLSIELIAKVYEITVYI